MKKRDWRKRTDNVFLPGDRMLWEVHRIQVRDNRLNWQEKIVADCAYTCALYRRNYRRWQCSSDDPCVYCLEVERLTK